ncbi:hypothetical protein HWV23_16980 [Natronomonas halophila]|uniref:hypothetical protein n=1 Tax=Natronomonas halophila TaxID=2747817 RepID=UPI0015B60FCE|nr:hypothetical protein [Natronomonas halophila]QLD87346.1 hypothetical protein HWV23_16980 [Natronomonas halophila]
MNNATIKMDIDQTPTNRRTVLKLFAAGGTAGFAGCPNSTSGNNKEDAIAVARSELSQAVEILNNIGVVANGRLTVGLEKFEGYSPKEITAHTDVVSESLSHDEGEEGRVLSISSKILNKTAYQYESIENVFRTFSSYKQRYIEDDYANAMQTGNQFTTYLSEVTERSNIITENLASLNEAGHETPVDGFSIQRWAHEQGAILESTEPMTPLGIGFVRHANGMRTLQRAAGNKRDGQYQNAIKQASEAQDSFKIAEEKFSESLDLGIEYRRTLVGEFACLSRGFLNSTELVIESLEAYADGEESMGDDLWKQAISHINKVNDTCLAGSQST